MSGVFDAYAAYYDLIYQDKDYAKEADYVDGLIKQHLPDANSILELGCGTGAHAEYFARKGFKVNGIDLSESMINRAESRRKKMPGMISDRLCFSADDIRSIRFGRLYDVVVSLFHVISYQSRNEDLRSAFETAFVHLKPGGVFIFDFWYGPAVLSMKPETRVKRIDTKDVELLRIAEPQLYPDENLVDVHYQILMKRLQTSEYFKFEETHRVRYLFLPEIRKLLDDARLEFISASEWMMVPQGHEIGADAWAGVVVARK